MPNAVYTVAVTNDANLCTFRLVLTKVTPVCNLILMNRAGAALEQRMKLYAPQYATSVWSLRGNKLARLLQEPFVSGCFTCVTLSTNKRRTWNERMDACVIVPTTSFKGHVLITLLCLDAQLEVLKITLRSRWGRRLEMSKCKSLWSYRSLHILALLKIGGSWRLHKRKCLIGQVTNVC